MGGAAYSSFSMRASVADGDDGGSRVVNFDVSIAIKNRLDAINFARF